MERLISMHGRALYFGAPYRAVEGVTTDAEVLFERTVICHDTRTKELCEFGGVPHSLLQDISPDFEIADLQQATNIGKFLRTHAGNYSDCRRFLDRNGIPHTLAKPESYASVG